MRTYLGISVLGASFLAFLCGACGTTPDEVSAQGPADSGVQPSDASTCAANDTRACTCAGADGGLGKSGSQACYSNSWLLCNCLAAVIPPANLEGSCKAGRYEGTFSGLYTSGYTFVGVPIPVFALNPLGPGLAFTLNEQETGSGGEFSTFTISDGFVKGSANGVFPFEGVLTGTLDCETKTFTGTLSGSYCVGPCLGVGVNQAEFSGPVHGNYDGLNFSFTNGTWDLLELGNPTGAAGIPLGGNGVWDAKWVGEGSVDVDSGVTTQP